MQAVLTAGFSSQLGRGALGTALGRYGGQGWFHDQVQYMKLILCDSDFIWKPEMEGHL